MREKAHYYVLALCLVALGLILHDIAGELHLANDRHLVAYCGRVER